MAAFETPSIECTEEVITIQECEVEDCNARVKLRKTSDIPLLVTNETDGYSETADIESKTMETVAKKRKETRKKSKKIKWFDKGVILAVRSEEDDFWLCQTKQDVYETTETFAIRWLNSDGNAKEYVLGSVDTTELQCVIADVTLERKVVYTIRDSEKQRIMNILKEAAIKTDVVDENESS